MEETGAKPGTLKFFQRGIGKVFMVAAGMGAVVLVIFVVVPMLTAPAALPGPMLAADIGAEVLKIPAGTGDNRAEEADMAAVPSPLSPVDEEALPGHAPLVALRESGEEVPVLFPIVEPGPGEGAAAGSGLPPVLSPEEVATAMSDPESADAQPVEDTGAPDTTQGGEPQPATAPQEMPWQPDLMVAGGSHGSRLVETTLPPPSATRQVQALLEALGYGPGPLDGIWGERTAGAWHRFARDARGHEARTRLAQSQPENPVVPVLPERPAPAEGDLVAERYDESQAGEMQAGRPPQSPVQETEPVRVPGTLRGVMGYRLPLISRQEVPDQVVAGVLIPAHTTFVILRGGEWELVDLAPDEVRRLEDAAEAAAAPPESEPQPPKRSWNPLRLFRRQTPHQGDK